MGLVKVKRKNIAKDDIPITDKINYIETNLFLFQENEKTILKEATTIHKLLAKKSIAV